MLLKRNVLLLVGVSVVVAMFAIGLYAGTHHGGAGTATADEPSTPPVADAHTALSRTLPATIFRTCTADAAREGAGRVTSLSCSSPLAGVDELLVTHWSDPAAMAAAFAAAYGNKPDGKCGSYTGAPASGVRSTYGGGAPLACFVNSNGAAIVLWEYPAQALQVLAVRTDGNTRAAFTWWTQAVKTPVS